MVPFDDFAPILRANGYSICYWIKLANLKPTSTILSLAKRGALLPTFQLYKEQGTLKYKS